MSIYNRDKSEWVGFKSGCLEVIEKVGEEDYQNKGNNGKVYVYKQDLLRVVCKCGKERTVKAKSFVGNKPESCRFCATKKKEPIGEKCYTLVCKSTIHERYPNGRSKILFVTECEVCKTNHTVRADVFRLQETGCPTCNKNNKMHFISGNEKKTTLSRYFSSIKSRCKKIGYGIDITQEYIFDLLKAQNNKCALSGQEISFDNGTASLDRIDNEKGYLINNVQWLHRNVNYMKNSMPQEMFLNWCRFIVKNSS